MPKGITKLTVKLFLYEISPQIWRRFTISSNATFAQLHETIQVVMGWENKELHEFRYGKGKNLTDVIATMSDEIVVQGKFIDENEFTIAQFLSKRKLPLRILYRYDFFEDWVHEVVFEKQEEGDAISAELIGGERACPPEDCGGTMGYMSGLEGDVEWMDDEYDPELFDPTAITLK